MGRCVIVGAAEIQNYSKIKTFLNPDDFYIFCDGGLKHKKELGVEPDLIIGDFDSFEKPETQIELIHLPCEKDDTDCFYAAKEAVARGFLDFVLIGVIGNRFDHSLCNISILMYLQEQGALATIIDDYSEMQLVGGANKVKAQIPATYSYFSLMCVDGTASGVSIKDAKYPLENGQIKTSYQYAISNEVLPGKVASVTVDNGVLLLVKVW